MLISNICFSVLIFAFVFRAAYTDVKWGLVKNKLISAALVFGALIAFVVYKLGEKPVISDWQGVSNLFFSIAFTAVFYFFDIWAPGDAKLFLVIVLLFPLQLYHARPFDVFPALKMIIWAFSAGYVFLLAETIIKRDASNRSSSRDLNFLEFCKSFLASMLYPFLLSFSISYIVHSILAKYFFDYWADNQSLVILGIIGLCLISRYMPKKMGIPAGILLLVGGFWLFPYTGFGWGAMSSIIMSVLIALTIQWSNEHISKGNYMLIPGERVRPGMILSAVTIVQMHNCIDENIPHSTTESRRSRISVKQADAVKLWAHNAKQDILVIRTIPFAPFIAFGALYELIHGWILSVSR